MIQNIGEKNSAKHIFTNSHKNNNDFQNKFPVFVPFNIVNVHKSINSNDIIVNSILFKIWFALTGIMMLFA